MYRKLKKEVNKCIDRRDTKKCWRKVGLSVRLTTVHTESVGVKDELHD